ncbi:type 2 lantipeptide synthetase LanM (plasmid) [Haloferax mediterranei ATCC 33500]|uniref:Lanthionine synthetase n=1 Tax=Haloferax mediterranei (strain ATCC 33500 / DSM 1411 / JCM 8866 / NBRC 14739 / NCIMB 2177 / R-4) TaxID=523841 RepID=I3R9P1_HALMT|nr:type 2 lanthipeptide synthetase LanM family protein [Haloferax mediterranei]AFK20951.1 lantibiotic modifying enzyme [Haloferax mediterranei ATCC 33500]AHZ24181.1 lanthionine synthetase [Haloferax mediterranei ATCC 33500]EMA05261.1 lantibiotic modifying enzyme [Haloferax mediterranei ATCC 33500]MDX5989937.1 type 2 lanthipeptide synthetase LanM family protein [Haloferax mediterranei ATCC 33500]QCQ77127.1 type 2 lantipeptide synthetase LanM [Haloferax mediterranei ATCC 33500]
MAGVFTEEFKRLIVGRSQTLLERVENPDDFENALRDDSTAAKAYQDWEDVFLQESILDARLEQSGVTRADIRQAAKMDKLSDNAELPDWIYTLDDIVESVLQRDPGELQWSEYNAVSGEEYPFAELLAAIAEAARDQIAGDEVRDVLSDEAINTMMDWFIIRLKRRFVRILFVEFKTFIASRDRDLAFADPDEFDDPPTKYYDEFIEYIFEGGFADLCQEYPLFGRLLVCQIRQWCEHIQEFSQRLQADRKALEDTFADDGELGRIQSLEPLADDTHGDGRAIMRVSFDADVTVVYKPRNVDAGATFYSVLDRLNAELDVPDFLIPTYLPRDGYGWMEWIESTECTDTDAVERYYRRAGSLTCIAYLLHFTDCQYENLVVSGEHPVLVDAETVCAPYFYTDKRPFPTGTGVLMNRSVFLTLLLPMGSREDDQLSGLGEATAGFSVSAEEREIEDLTNSVVAAVNTDLMNVQHVPSKFDRSENIPSVDGEEFRPDEYLSEIIDGFQTTYETIIALRDSGKLSSIGLPDAFESIENRTVWRPTMRYAACIDSLSARLTLHDGAWFGAEIERLSVPFFDGRIDDPDVWPIYKSEYQKMCQFEPPRFSCKTDETAIRMNGTEIGVNADVPGLTVSRERIESADREDMLTQIEFIRGAFGTAPDPNKSEYIDVSATPRQISDERLREEARTLFESVKSATVQTDTGQRHFSSVVPRSESSRLALQPGDHSLYSGRSGPALLGAALYATTGVDQYKTFALEILKETRKAVRAESISPALYMHGGTNGLGAVAYGLAVVGELVDEQTLVEDAARTAEFVTDETFETDSTFDVSGGAAGTILGLLAANDRHSSESLVSAARKCGEHLLVNRVETDDGLAVWQTLDDSPPLTGFAHGAIGIAYALIRLADETGEEKYRDAAYEALEFESRKYSESERNWPDNRSWSNNRFHDQWCYGRSGEGLARAGMVNYDDGEILTKGLKRAVEGFPQRGLKEYDHLCCGETGRVEFLLEAERLGELPDGGARERIGAIVDRKDESGTYRTEDDANRITNPTFFHGLSGIAYTMLRVTAPDQIPNVLRWE